MSLSSWLFVITPELKNTKDHFDLRLETLEKWEILESLDSDQYIEQHAKGELTKQVIEENGRELKIRNYEFSADLNTGEVIWEVEKIVTVDKFLRKSIDLDSYFLFPLNTQQQDYKFGLFGDKPHEFSFVKSLELGGMTIYEFSSTNTYDISESYEKFPDVKIFAKQTTTYQIEPNTGQMISHKSFWQDYIISDEGKIIVSNGNTAISDYSRDILLDKVRQMNILFYYYDFIIPLFLIISIILAGTLIQVLQMVFKKQKEIELKEKEKFEIIGQLSSSLAHDIRSPLSTIQNSIQMVKNERSKDYFLKTMSEDVLTSVKKINYHIEQILEFVKKPKVFYQNVSLMQILDSVMSSVDIPITIKLEKPKNDIRINCDPLKIEVLFTNIFTNAIQAINNESGLIKIRWSEEKDSIKIEVENNGPNIPKEYLKCIFDPLFTTKTYGSGLGLLSCKNIVDVHKGKISVNNNPVVFKIELPKNKLESESLEIAKEPKIERRTD